MVTMLKYINVYFELYHCVQSTISSMSCLSTRGTMVKSHVSVASKMPSCYSNYYLIILIIPGLFV